MVKTRYQTEVRVKNWGDEGEKVRLLESRVITVTIYWHLPCFGPSTEHWLVHIISYIPDNNPERLTFCTLFAERLGDVCKVTQLDSKACACD